MRRFLVFAWVLLTAGAAQATILATTAMYAPTGYTPGCGETNLGKKTLDVMVRIVGLDGTVIESSTVQTPAGSTNGISTALNFTGWARCEFEFKGSRKGVRAVMTIDNSATGLSQTVLPAE